MRKLVIYRSEADYHAMAGSYPCLVNFNHVKKFGEFDDGCGNTMHIDFAVAETDAEVLNLDTKSYDAVEVIAARR